MLRQNLWKLTLCAVIVLWAAFNLVPLKDQDFGDYVKAEAAEAKFGPIDVWINNAMASVFSPVAEMRAEEYRRVTEVTYLGYVYGTLAALHRMRLYEAEYGYTRLRLLVQAVELALGAGFLLVLLAGAVRDARWLPGAAVGVVTAALLSLAAVDPDAWVASHNVERYRETGKVDLIYLRTLSADAVPALLELPPDLRDCALARIRAQLLLHDDPWYDENLGRHRARSLLEDEPVRPCTR